MRENCGTDLHPFANDCDQTAPFLPPEQLSAARLWCRTGSWPTEHEIAADSDAGTTMMIAKTRGPIVSRERVARVQVDELMWAYRRNRRSGSSAASALDAAARERVTSLFDVEPELVYLPLLACITARARRNHQLACARAIVDVLSATASGSDIGWRPAAGEDSD